MERNVGNYNIKEWKEFLNRNYDILTFNMRPSDCLVWLITCDVFTQSDKEEVQCKDTTQMQMCQLVDIILRKGERGFNAFMNIVEFTYPEVYSSITGETPRMPTEEYMRPFNIQSQFAPTRVPRPMSIEILASMGDLIKQLTLERCDGRQKMSRLQKYVNDMQNTVRNEKAELYLQLKNANEQIHHLKQEKDESKERLQRMTKEREELRAEVARVRLVKDRYVDDFRKVDQERNNLATELHSLTEEFNHFKRTSLLSQPSFYLTTDNTVASQSSHDSETSMPHYHFEATNKLPNGIAKQDANVATKSGDQGAKQTSLSNGNSSHNCQNEGTLKSKLEAAQKENLVLSFEKAQLENLVGSLQKNNASLQSKVDQLKRDLSQVENERDQLQTEKLDLDEELTKERDDHLKKCNSFDNYRNKHTYLESRHKKLQEEFQQLKDENRCINCREMNGEESKRHAIYPPTLQISHQEINSPPINGNLKIPVSPTRISPQAQNAESSHPLKRKGCLKVKDKGFTVD